MEYKMYAVVSLEALKSMNGVRGKFGTQMGHAYLHAWWDAAERFPEAAQAYKDSGFAKKITVGVADEAALRELEAHFKPLCGVSLVTDKGLTVFKNEDGSPRPTTTCLGIGPITNEMIGDHPLGKMKPLT